MPASPLTAHAATNAPDNLGVSTSQAQGEISSLPDGAHLDRLLSIKSGSHLDGAGKTLHINPGGGFIGEAVSDVVIENFVFVLWEGATVAEADNQSLFHFRDCRGITIKNNRIVSRLQSPIDREPLTENPKPYGQLAAVFTWAGRNEKVQLTGNIIHAEAMYTTRLMIDLPDEIQVQAGTRFGAATSEKIQWEIAHNSIQGFHEALNLSNCLGGVVSRNLLRLNSFGNIVISGNNINIEGNTILFSGAGTSGDGITVSDVRDLRIARNQIFFGTCYGIWFCGTAASVVIEDNLICSGITAGINLQSLSTNESPFRNFRIRRNTLAHNGGYGTQVFHGVDITLEENIFIGNDPLPAKASNTATLQVRMTNNQRTVKTMPTLTSKLQFLQSMDGN